MISFCSCGNKKVFPKKNSIQIEAPYYVIIHDLDEIPINTEFAILSKTEIDEIFSILKLKIDIYNKDEPDYWKIDLSEYRFQLVPHFNQKNEKIIWINSLCNEMAEGDPKNETWREMIEIWDDGGKCFFNLYVNLKTHKAYNLGINGEA